MTNDPGLCICTLCKDRIRTNESNHKVLQIEVEFDYGNKEIESKEYYKDLSNAN